MKPILGQVILAHTIPDWIWRNLYVFDPSLPVEQWSDATAWITVKQQKQLTDALQDQMNYFWNNILKRRPLAAYAAKTESKRKGKFKHYKGHTINAFPLYMEQMIMDALKVEARKMGLQLRFRNEPDPRIYPYTFVFGEGYFEMPTAVPLELTKVKK